MSHQIESTGLEIAVIGMAGRFPGASSVDALWLKVRDGVDCVSALSEAELAASGVDPNLVRHPDYVRAAAVLADADLFDAEFFGFSPREAELLDPQQRLFLECAWEALENAGYAGDVFKGLIGVCAGTGRNGYLQQNVYTNPDLVGAAGAFQTILNNEKDSVALRTAYQLNLGGPSLTIQTACSTSLVAVHVACQNLLAGECDICLAGGVSIALPQKVGYLYTDGLMQSRDGRCRAYDAAASGAVLGRGVGIVVLKRLADAIDDGDTVLAVIKGSAVNNDGSSKIGYTAPSIEGQARVIRTAHLRAGVAPETISFVEGHGTATPLGDPVEVAALNEAFGLGPSRPGTCALGSLKSNMGHLDAAAGVAGLIKTILALRHRQLPPSLHFTSPNPKIEFGAGPFYVNTRLQDWPEGSTPRRAGVSSFGMGGTNAHVVVEEAPAIEEQALEHSRRLLVLSARSEAALERATDDLAAFLRANPRARLDDVAFTLQVGRKAFNHRRAIVCGDASGAIAAMEARHAQPLLSSVTENRDRSFAFMFPGQGAQYPGLGRGLFDEYREFRAVSSECFGLLARHMPGIDLRKVMHDAPADSAAHERLARTDLAQPALFVVEYALARQLMSWGITPAAMIGHSVGEFVAACLAGVFTLDEALGLVAARGRLMQALPPGGMMAIPVAHGEAASLVAGTSLSIAAINGPRLSVVAGPFGDIDELEAKLAKDGLTGARLRTSHAFHSSMMDPITEAFAGLVARTTRKAPSIPYVSNVTGTWITAAEATDPAYWAKHLRQPVLFATGIRALLGDARRAVLEVGPGATLTTLARQNSPGPSAVILQTMPRAQEKETDCAALLGALARVWLAGVSVDFARVNAGEKRRRVALPAYPFERKRFWVDPARTATDRRPRQSPMARRPRVDEWCYAPAWKASSADLSSSAPARWLVLADESPLGRAIVSDLSGGAADVIQVIAGERFERRNRQTYVVGTDLRADYERIFNELHADGRAIDRIALLPVRAAGEGEAGFYSLLFLLQALASSRSHKVTKLVVGTAHARPVTGAEQLNTSDATMLGLCRVASQEFPGMSCTTVDVDPPADPEHARQIAVRLARELTSDAADSVVAWRGYKRWVLGFDEVAVAAGTGPRLRNDGVYLITGGLGRVGLTLARRIAREGARLVLTATSPLPARERWEALTAETATDTVLERVRAIQAIEQAGANVTVEAVDVSSREQMTRLVGDLERRFGRIDGVVHAAGVTRGPSFTTIQQLDRLVCEQQFAPKVGGVRALEEALAGRPLDFCLLTSSLASLLGGVGFGAYAAANAYLDAAAHVHHARGESWWVSANWEGWNFGNASGAGARWALTPEDGAAAFAHIVSAPALPQIAISTASLEARLAQADPSATERDQDRRPLTAYERPNLQNPYLAPASDVERAVAAIWMELLGVDRVGVRDNFFELGGHSLLATRAVASLRQSFGGSIPVAAMFEHPTVESLAQMISGQTRTVAGLTKASGRGERRREALRHLEAEKAIR